MKISGNKLHFSVFCHEFRYAISPTPSSTTPSIDAYGAVCASISPLAVLSLSTVVMARSNCSGSLEGALTRPLTTQDPCFERVVELDGDSPASGEAAPRGEAGGKTPPRDFSALAASAALSFRSLVIISAKLALAVDASFSATSALF